MVLLLETPHEPRGRLGHAVLRAEKWQELLGAP